MIGFGVKLAILVVMLVFAFVGVAAGNPVLILPWLCLSVPLSLLVGRASAKVIRGRKLVLVADDQAPLTSKLR